MTRRAFSASNMSLTRARSRDAEPSLSSAREKERWGRKTKRGGKKKPGTVNVKQIVKGRRERSEESSVPGQRMCRSGSSFSEIQKQNTSKRGPSRRGEAHLWFVGFVGGAAAVLFAVCFRFAVRARRPVS